MHMGMYHSTLQPSAVSFTRLAVTLLRLVKMQASQASRCTCGLKGRTYKLQVMAVFDFASIKKKEPGVRPNRGLMKKEARDVQYIVRGLTQMTEKQLKAISHLVDEDILDAVKIAAKLTRSNQGRKRQEMLVAKMLRTELDEPALAKLMEASQLAETYNGIYVDSELQDMVEVWKEGLLNNHQAVFDEVLSYPKEWLPEPQQLRQLVRQYQQFLKEEAEAPEAQDAQVLPQPAAVADHCTSSAVSAQSGADAAQQGPAASRSVEEDGEVLDLGGLRRSAKRKKQRGQPLKSQAALKALTKMLHTLAEKVVLSK